MDFVAAHDEALDVALNHHFRNARQGRVNARVAHDRIHSSQHFQANIDSLNANVCVVFVA